MDDELEPQAKEKEDQLAGAVPTAIATAAGKSLSSTWPSNSDGGNKEKG